MPGRILIVDNVATNRIVLKVKLASSGHHVLQADTGARALSMIRDDQPDLAILDADAGDMTGLDLCRAIRSGRDGADLPVIFVASALTPAIRLAALAAGAAEILEKPLDETMLKARVRALLRARATMRDLARRAATASELGFAEAAQPFGAAGRVVLIGRSQEEALAWHGMLAGRLAERIDVADAKRALGDRGGEASGDVYLISADLDRPGAGLHLMSELRARDAGRHAGMIVVHEPAALGQAVMALDLGADGVAARGMAAAEYALRITRQLEIKRRADHLRRSVDQGLKMAMVDSLTGLHNRRYALAHLAKVAREARDANSHFAVMLVDIDRFKRVNDTWGHAVGDIVLTEVARRLKSNLRAQDLAARIGGEEFLIVMPATTLVEARAAAERLLHAVHEAPVAAPGASPALPVTVSIGLAMGGACTPDDTDPSVEEIIGIADKALYGAKAEGRNQVSLGSYAA